MSGDGYHITSPPEDGRGAPMAMQMAMKDAGINPEQIDYINAHGTSTELGDLAETRAIKSVFGSYAKKVFISSTKSQLGHSLGASGGIEAIITSLAAHRQPGSADDQSGQSRSGMRSGLRSAPCP